MSDDWGAVQTYRLVIFKNLWIFFFFGNKIWVINKQFFEPTEGNNLINMFSLSFYFFFCLFIYSFYLCVSVSCVWSNHNHGSFSLPLWPKKEVEAAIDVLGLLGAPSYILRVFRGHIMQFHLPLFFF